MFDKIKKIGTAIRTNENEARPRAIVAGAILLGSIAAGFYFTKKLVPQPLVLVVEEVVETVSDASA